MSHYQSNTTTTTTTVTTVLWLFYGTASVSWYPS